MKHFNSMLKVTIAVGIIALFISCDRAPAKHNENVVISSNTIEEPINDAEMLKHFEQTASAYYKDFGGVDAKTYQEQLGNKTCEVTHQGISTTAFQGAALYKQFRKGVLMMGKMAKCGHCPDDHLSTASAFVIAEEGICVTNYHVFKSYDPSKPSNYITLFVMDIERNIYPVTEVLAASKKDDLVIFRVNTKGQKMSSLKLGEEQGIGQPIHLISHPDRRFYTYTQGHVDRKYVKPGTTKIRQSISAEFAKGSSGAPILDDCGNVVGIVAGTQNIYYDKESKIYQSTIKEIIPVSRLKELIK